MERPEQERLPPRRPAVTDERQRVGTRREPRRQRTRQSDEHRRSCGIELTNTGPGRPSRRTSRFASGRLELFGHRPDAQRMLEPLCDDNNRPERICAAVCLGNPAALSPEAGSQTAAAAQSNPTNVNISVRVGSPGHDTVPTQANTADADAASASATVSGESNINVSVVLPGADVVVPSGSDPWIWHWVWTLGTVPAPGDAPTGSNTWLWTWIATQSAAAANGAG